MYTEKLISQECYNLINKCINLATFGSSKVSFTTKKNNGIILTKLALSIVL